MGYPDLCIMDSRILGNLMDEVKVGQVRQHRTGRYVVIKREKSRCFRILWIQDPKVVSHVAHRNQLIKDELIADSLTKLEKIIYNIPLD